MGQMPSPSVKLVVSPNSRGNNPFLSVKPVIFPDDRDKINHSVRKIGHFPGHQWQICLSIREIGLFSGREQHKVGWRICRCGEKCTNCIVAPWHDLTILCHGSVQKCPNDLFLNTSVTWIHHIVSRRCGYSKFQPTFLLIYAYCRSLCWSGY